MPKVADINVWKAKRSTEYLGYPDEKDLGWLPATFTPYEPDKKYSWATRTRESYEFWPIVTPRRAPPVRHDYPELMQKMIDATWVIAEPKGGVVRGSAGNQVGLDAPTIGMRGTPEPLFKAVRPANETYHPQERPSAPVMLTIMGNKSAIATDWGLHDTIERVNAVTFRGDKRPPFALIIGAGGFFLPRPAETAITSKTRSPWPSRTISGVDSAARSNWSRSFARSTARQSCKRIWIWPTNISCGARSCTRNWRIWRAWSTTSSSRGGLRRPEVLDSSMTFALFNQTPGWLYVTVVHSAFVVPYAHISRSETWTSGEAEIAQYGPIPAERILGFAHVSKEHVVDTPIFMRNTFLYDEPKAFQAMFQALSGANSTKV